MASGWVWSLQVIVYRFYTCWRDAELCTATSQGFRLDEYQLKAEWGSIVSLTDHKGRSLDQVHVFVLAHVLRRPIIVYGVRVVVNYRGEKLGPVNYEGGCGNEGCGLVDNNSLLCRCVPTLTVGQFVLF